MGKLVLKGRHRLKCGDASVISDVRDAVGGAEANLVLTDPPYGVSYADKNRFLNAIGRPNCVEKPIRNDHESLDDLTEFWQLVMENAYQVTTNRAAYYWFACQGGDQMMMMMMSIGRANWKVRHELIWVKNCHVLGRCDYHYKHEPILYGWKQDGVHDWYGDSSQMSTLEYPKPHRSELHPTMKPIELLERLIQNSTKPDGLVLDLFLGSGSTIIASEKTGRRCFGMEIDSHYCDVILERWEKYTGKTAVCAN